MSYNGAANMQWKTDYLPCNSFFFMGHLGRAEAGCSLHPTSARWLLVGFRPPPCPLRQRL
ncbi:MAG: hypothetical protein R2795_22655 [Saprospiraceae bacterium]